MISNLQKDDTPSIHIPDRRKTIHEHTTYCCRKGLRSLKRILLPSDPLRAKFKNFLDNPKQYTAVRNILGFTGTYRAFPYQELGRHPVHLDLRAWLIHEFGCKKLFRVGTCGAMHSGCPSARCALIAQAASTDSSIIRNISAAPSTTAPIADS